MFAAALIVFRESLEAALFVGLVAAATRELSGRSRWLGAGVGLGALGALALALMASHISNWFDGLGQDVINIGVLTLALAMLLWHCIWVSTHAGELVRDARQLGSDVQRGQRRPWALLAAVALAVLREGAETVLFVGGALTGSAGTAPGPVLLSCVLGLLGGGALGWALYAGLARVPARHLFAVTNALIALLAASLASQLARALAQGGFVEAWSSPLWDSSWLLGADSALGTLLHALIGYDARPSGLQLAFYGLVLLLIGAATRMLKDPGPASSRSSRSTPGRRSA